MCDLLVDIGTKGLKSWNRTYICKQISFVVYKSTFRWKAKSIHTGLRFQTGVKTSSVHMTFHLGCISKWPDILMDVRRHFISGSVCVMFYHSISAKMSRTKFIPATSFKRTCALIAISNKPALTHFVSGKYDAIFSFSRKNAYLNSFRVESSLN